MDDFASSGSWSWDNAEFAAGYIYGFRSWTMVNTNGFLDKAGGVVNVVKLGVTLKGHFGKTWNPGLNIAVCAEGRHSPCPARSPEEKYLYDRAAQRFQEIGHKIQEIYQQKTYVFNVPHAYTFAPQSAYLSPEEREEYQRVQETMRQYAECGCGFWAYWNLAEQQKSFFWALYDCTPHQVIGVIRAYGNIIHGQKGFRAEKAEIAALVIPAGFAPFCLRSYEQAGTRLYRSQMELEEHYQHLVETQRA